MGRIFLSAAHGGLENGKTDPGSIAGGTTEAREMILTRDLVITELRSRGLEVLSVPDDLSAQQTLDWINARGINTDVSLELHADSATTPSIRGTSVFYIYQNDQRKKHADLILLALAQQVPRLPNRGARPDTTVGVGNLAFCRQLVTPSLLLQLGFLTNTDDRFIIQNQRREIAVGLANGLQSWLKDLDSIQPTPDYPSININVNSRDYSESGVLINGNAYIPIDLVDQLGVDLSTAPTVRRISYRNIVYVKAIELRDFNVVVNWNATTRTVILKSTLNKICPGPIDYIMDHGKTTELQLMMFLKSGNEAAVRDYSDIAKIYREESAIEGVDYDIAFCQMCLETNYLRFSTTLTPGQNNFGGLGAAGGNGSASFPNRTEGVRAHVQHLKAYASTAPLSQAVVDPRFRFVTRGIAPLVGQLNGRWSADPKYGEKLLAIVRNLYEKSGILS